MRGCHALPDERYPQTLIQSEFRPVPGELNRCEYVAFTHQQVSLIANGDFIACI